MNKLFKSLSFLALTCSFLLTSCGGSGNTTPSSGTNPDDELPNFEATPGDKDSWEYLPKDENGNVEEYEIEWYVNSATFAWNSYGSDRVSQIIKEKTGAKIKFVTPATDDGTKLATLISGNKLPDVVSVQCWYNQVHQMANQGYLYSFDSLINKWAPSFNERKQEDIWNYFKEGNGHTYGFPNFAYSTKYVNDKSPLEPNGALMVRKDWYEEVLATGNDMTTPDKFIAGCEMIKAKHTGSVPFQLSPFTNEGCQSIKWLEQYFNCAFEDESGKYLDTRTTENYQDMLKFLNECNSKGVILSENYSAKSDQVQKNISRGNVFVSVVTPQDYQMAFLNCYNKDIQYIPLILKNYKNEAPVLQDLSGNGYLLNMISKNCERPDKVIKLMDFLYSEEGQRLIAFGVEGETYNWNEDKTRLEWTPRYISGINQEDLNDTAWVNSYGLFQMTLAINVAYTNTIKPLNAMSETDKYIDNLKRPLIPYSYNFKPTFLKHDTGHQDYFKVSTTAKKIDTKWVSQLISILRADNYLTAYKAAITYANRQGLKSVQEFYSASYETTKELLDVTYGYPTHQDGYKPPVTGPNGDTSLWR